jgi:hypothetical protein
VASKNSKRAAAEADDIWADHNVAEKPAKNSEAVRLSERWVRTIRGYTKLSVWAFPVMAIIMLVIYTETGNTTVAETQTITNQVNSPGKDAAIIAANTWIESVPAPILGGKILSWNGFDLQPKVTVADSLKRDVTTPEYDVEIHHFTVIDNRGQQYTSDVAVAVSAVNGAIALGTPSLNPIAPSATGWAGSGAWYGLERAPQPDAVTAAITAWARAFVSGDPDELRLAVGDNDPSHSYVPLTGVTSVVPSIVAVAAVPVLRSDGTKSDAPATQLVVQIQLRIIWKETNQVAYETDADGIPIIPDSVQTRGDSLITYDLIIDRADGAAPQIVAWGGAGSGQQLTPYSNAVIDREITAAEGN